MIGRKNLLRRMMDCRGSLSGLATPDAAARRREIDDDPDGWIDSGDEFWLDRKDLDPDSWLLPFDRPFDLDVTKILYSKALRRLSRKTQVFTGSRNSHTRDRRVHSDEVVGAATTIARILGLNESLCRAGALGHDLGHAPFGHAGEALITKLSGRPFRHEVFGVVVCQHVERRGRGLNLTHQTLECIANHSRGGGELVLTGVSAEADVVMYADKISYIFADYNDLSRRRSGKAGWFLEGEGEHTKELIGLMSWFGADQRERVRTCIAALCVESAEQGHVCFRESEVAQRFEDVKGMMYRVYKRVPHRLAEVQMALVYEHLVPALPGIDPAVVLALLNDLDIPWLADRTDDGHISRAELDELSVGDILPHLQDRVIDFTDVDLAW